VEHSLPVSWLGDFPLPLLSAFPTHVPPAPSPRSFRAAIWAVARGLAGISSRLACRSKTIGPSARISAAGERENQARKAGSNEKGTLGCGRAYGRGGRADRVRNALARHRVSLRVSCTIPELFLLSTARRSGAGIVARRTRFGYAGPERDRRRYCHGGCPRRLLARRIPSPRQWSERPGSFATERRHGRNRTG
jgi:hypothetical protein